MLIQKNIENDELLDLVDVNWIVEAFDIQLVGRCLAMAGREEGVRADGRCRALDVALYYRSLSDVKRGLVCRFDG